MSRLHSHPDAGYAFLPGIPAFSEGIIALPGHRIVHVRLAEPVPLERGYNLIEERLADWGRSLSALCGVELRIPEQMEIPAFRTLNAGYIAQLRDSWGLFIDGVNPVPRCNLVLTVDPVTEPALFGFSFTEPQAAPGPQFVTAGINDAGLVYGQDVFAKVAQGIVPERAPDAPPPGHGAPETVARRLAFILDAAQTRLAALGVGWQDASQVELYLTYPLGDLMQSHVLPALGPAGRRGVRWHAGLAPFLGPEAEMDVRGYDRAIELHVLGGKDDAPPRPIRNHAHSGNPV